MKLLLDMNISPKLMAFLKENGIESEHWFFIGAPDAQDTEIMAYARNNNCIIVTCDLDFSAILSVTHGFKPSIVQLRFQGFHLEQTAKLIASALAQNRTELETGAILTIDIKKARVRILPL